MAIIQTPINQIHFLDLTPDHIRSVCNKHNISSSCAEDFIECFKLTVSCRELAFKVTILKSRSREFYNYSVKYFIDDKYYRLEEEDKILLEDKKLTNIIKHLNTILINHQVEINDWYQIKKQLIKLL